jgi:hypothetical protein
LLVPDRGILGSYQLDGELAAGGSQFKSIRRTLTLIPPPNESVILRDGLDDQAPLDQI